MSDPVFLINKCRSYLNFGDNKAEIEKEIQSVINSQLKIRRGRRNELVVSCQVVINPFCGLPVIFCGCISHLIGRETINIPEILSGVHGFTGKTVRRVCNIPRKYKLHDMLDKTVLDRQFMTKNNKAVQLIYFVIPLNLNSIQSYLCQERCLENLLTLHYYNCVRARG